MTWLKRIVHRMAYVGFSAVTAGFFMPVLWLIRPLVSIKVSCVPGHRMGHLAHDLGSLVILKKAEGNKNTYVVFTPVVCNPYIRDVYSEDMIIIEHTRLFDFVLATIPVMAYWGVYVDPPYTKNAYSTFSGGERTLRLPEHVASEGAVFLERIGVSRDAWFVAFHSRDSDYFSKRFPKAGLAYHDYRNSHVETYLKAAEKIVSRGGFAIRMGTRDSRPLPAERNPRVIDYATEHSNPLLDFYICLKSRFILANTSGLYAVGTVAGVPVAAANMIPLFTLPITPNDLFIPKLLKRRDEDRFLTFQEIADFGVGDFFRAEQFQESGLEIIDNTEDEIADLCEEMFDRLDGAPTPPSGKAQQDAFREFVLARHPELSGCGDISYRFLERHPYLLP